MANLPLSEHAAARLVVDKAPLKLPVITPLQQTTPQEAKREQEQPHPIPPNHKSWHHQKPTMFNNKENEPSSLDGPAAGASTTSATGDSKKPKTQDGLKAVAYDGLDDVVMGGCSTCGSLHDTVKCDHQDAPSEYMMSGALQTDQGSSAGVSATASTATTQAEKGSQAQPDMPSGQDSGRRRSV